MGFTTDLIAARYSALAAERIKARGYMLPYGPTSANVAEDPALPRPVTVKALGPFRHAGREIAIGEVVTVRADDAQSLEYRNLAERIGNKSTKE